MEAAQVHGLQHDPRVDVIDLTSSPIASASSTGAQPISDKSKKVGSIPSSHDRPASGPPVSVVRESAAKPHGSVDISPLASSHRQNRLKDSSSSTTPTEHAFGSSIEPAASSSSNRPKTASQGYSSYIKPGTPGAFKSGSTKTGDAFHRVVPDPLNRVTDPAQSGEWPSWLMKGRPNFGLKEPSIPAQTVSRPGEEDTLVEKFDLDAIPLTADDYDRHEGDADKHMRELLAGAIGDAEDGMGDDAVKEGEDIVEGLAKGVRLMPHQVRGVRWMRGRESGRKYGGILADVSYDLGS